MNNGRTNDIGARKCVKCNMWTVYPVHHMTKKDYNGKIIIVLQCLYCNKKQGRI